MKTTMIAAAAAALIVGVAVVGGTSIASAQVQLTPSQVKNAIKIGFRQLRCVPNGGDAAYTVFIQNITGKTIPAGRTIYWTATYKSGRKDSGRHMLRSPLAPRGWVTILPALYGHWTCTASVLV